MRFLRLFSVFFLPVFFPVFVPAFAFAVSGTSPVRGSIADFDPGPPVNSEWPDIFAETPNYLGIGNLVNQKPLGPEWIDEETGKPVRVRFRWQFGPMFYRGRLTPESVKVLIIGQEGAQDENISNRTFTGSTGTKMQNFIDYMGITKSYLFLNTFMYTINGQYGGPNGVPPNIYWVAQDPNSPLVIHRHRAFDYVLSTNKTALKLVIGVGRAGQDSVVTWVQHLARQRGLDGQKLCPYLAIFKTPDTRSTCDASFVGLKVVGLPHPGAASALNGGDAGAATLKNDFPNTANRIRSWITSDANWGFKPDVTPPASAFEYTDKPVPHADFPYGSMWVMGSDGTSSNRDSADAITVFSHEGCYNAMVRTTSGKCANKEEVGADKKEPLSIIYTTDEDSRSPDYQAGIDVAWEAPKSKVGRRLYDSGPATVKLARLLLAQEPGIKLPDFKSLGVTTHESLGLGGTYRGRLDQARVLILADQESWDDLFTARALTGTGGQKLQAWLNQAGIDSSYAIVRTLPVDTLDMEKKQMVKAVMDDDNVDRLEAVVSEILKYGKSQVVLALGDGAQKYASKSSVLKKSKLEIIEMDQVQYVVQKNRLMTSNSELKSWQKAMKSFSKLKLPYETDNKPTYQYNEGDMLAIPRADLPYGTRFWVGQSGSRVVRAYNVGREGAYANTILPNGRYRKSGWDNNYYQIQAPSWVKALDPLPVSKDERYQIEKYWLNSN